MRPYFRTHYSADELAKYDLRKGSEMLGGTVIARSVSQLRERFEQFGASGYLHITLSAPAEIWLDRDTWLDSMRFVLKRHQFPVDLTPWIMVRHTDTQNDHGHCFVALETFDFREIDPIQTKDHTSETHQLLAERLGLPVPEYFSAIALPRIHAPVPLRRINRDPEYRRLADDLNAGLAAWPANLEALNETLAAQGSQYKIHEDLNQRGKPSLLCVSPTQRIRPSVLGEAFFPKNLRKRIELAGLLNRSRLSLDMALLLNRHEILNVLDAAEREKPEVKHSFKGTTPDADTDRKTATSDPGRDGKIELRVEDDQGGCADPSSPSGPAAGSGRIRPGRDGSGPLDQNDNGNENQAGNDRGGGGGHQGRRPVNKGDDRQDGGNARPSRRGFKQCGGLTLLGWIARVLAIARQVTPGFQHSLNILAIKVRLTFLDSSVVTVRPNRVRLDNGGSASRGEARRFAEAYASEFELIGVKADMVDTDILLTPGMPEFRNTGATRRKYRKNTLPSKPLALDEPDEPDPEPLDVKRKQTPPIRGNPMGEIEPDFVAPLNPPLRPNAGIISELIDTQNLLVDSVLAHAPGGRRKLDPDPAAEQKVVHAVAPVNADVSSAEENDLSDYEGPDF